MRLAAMGEAISIQLLAHPGFTVTRVQNRVILIAEFYACGHLILKNARLYPLRLLQKP